MNFLNPFFLLGALAVAIPVVIHFINLRRPKKLSFPTLTFFEELKKSTIRRLRIKQYLLLALRAAAILMLALALARPLLEPTGGSASDLNEPKIVALLFDNSPSMSRIGTEGPYFEQATQVARRIVEETNSEDRFLVTGTNTSNHGVQPVNPARALELLDELEISNTGNQISRSVRLISEQLKNSPIQQAVIYLITDAQESQVDDLSELNKQELGESGQQVLQLIKIGSASQSNIAVSDLQLESRMLSKDNPVTLQVEVRNYGDVGAANQFISLEVQNRMVGQYEVNLEPGESKQLLFEVVPRKVGDLPGKIVIEGDEVTFDNERHFVINIPETRSVLLVDENEEDASEFVSYLQPALEAARRANTQIDFNRQQPGEIDQSKWLQHDIIILDGLREIPEYWFNDLQKYVQEGSGLLFFPSEKGNINNYNSFLGLFNAGSFTGIRGEYASFKPIGSIGKLVEGHPILEGMFVKKENEDIQVNLPELFYYYQLEQTSGTGSYTVLSSSVGDDILVEQRFGDGRMLVSAIGADPGWSNFPVNALFAPIYYRSVLYASASEQGGLSNHELGNEFVWNGNIENRPVELQLEGVTYRPEVQTMPRGVNVRYSGIEWEPGILRILTENEERMVAVNQNILESDFDTLSGQELEKVLDNSVTIANILDVSELSREDLVNQLQSAGMGWEIWSWFIWVALILLVAETLVAKLYRAESIA